MHGLIPTRNSLSWLVLISFAQTLCRGPAVHFWVKGLSVHSGLTQCVGLDDQHTRQTGTANLCASKFFLFPLRVTNNQLFFNFQFLPYIYIYFSLPLKQADCIDMASRYPKTFRWLIWNFSQTALQQIQTAKTPTGDTFFHFSPLSPLLLSAYSSSVDIQWR